MTKLVILITSTVGGAVGWWMGAKVGIMTAFMVSMVGTGVGIYYGRKAAQHYEP
jgi:membrane protein YqaA with SNARE-associated domain